MKYTTIIILIYCNLLFAQEQDVFSDAFIKKNIEAMNNKTDNMIAFEYNTEFKIILKELLKIKWLEKAIKISDYYFPLFNDKLKQYDLPNDLKYLPILESGLNPKAKSKVGASGLWQFMESTGQSMGLKKDKYVNLFYCPIANTDSACRYIKSLYTSYKDWKLVLSCYNYGIGNIKKKIKKVGSNKYIDIYPYLPKETRAYVPKLLVIKYLATYKDIYYKKDEQFKYTFTDFRQIKIGKETTIKNLEKDYKMNENVIKFANPQILTNIVPKGAIVYLK